MSAHRCYLILFNIAKPVNFGHLIRTANALGSEPVVIGRKSWNACGAAGGTRRTPVHHFYTLDEGIGFVREAGCRVTGIEILPEARSVVDEPFSGPTAFLPGNEGTGLTPQHIALCDDFVYIPQFGTAVSLNINAATAVVLHRFATWAGRAECARHEAKFRSSHTVRSAHAALRSEPETGLSATADCDPDH